MMLRKMAAFFSGGGPHCVCGGSESRLSMTESFFHLKALRFHATFYLMSRGSFFFVFESFSNRGRLRDFCFALFFLMLFLSNEMGWPCSPLQHFADHTKVSWLHRHTERCISHPVVCWVIWGKRGATHYTIGNTAGESVLEDSQGVGCRWCNDLPKQ